MEIKEEGDRVLVRDSNDDSGRVLDFGLDAFRAFIAAVKGGDLPG